MESWFLVPYIERTLIKKKINKLYTNHNIAKSNYYPVVVTLAKDGLVDDKIPIKKIRSKSVVLSKPLRKGNRVQIIYEYWVGCEYNDGNEQGTFFTVKESIEKVIGVLENENY